MRKILQLVHVGLVLYMLVNILIAVYVAGMSVFVSAVNWGMHQMWGWHLFDPALVLLPLALLAKFPRRIVLLSGLLSLLVIVQVFLPNLRSMSAYASALHPVNAMLVFGTTVALLWQTVQFLRGEINGKQKIKEQA